MKKYEVNKRKKLWNRTVGEEFQMNIFKQIRFKWIYSNRLEYIQMNRFNVDSENMNNDRQDML